MVQVCLMIADMIGIFGTCLCILASFLLMMFNISIGGSESGIITLPGKLFRSLISILMGQGQRFGYELLVFGFILILIDKVASFICLHCSFIFDFI